MSDRAQSMTERVIATGVIQSVSTDLGVVTGAALVGVGIWQLSHPAVWIYAGVLVSAGSVLVMIARSRAAKAKALQERQ